MLAIFMIVLLITTAFVVWAVLSQPGRSAGSQADSESIAYDFHGSDANFGNSLQGDNSNFGQAFYDE
jgi:hypothetical protein